MSEPSYTSPSSSNGLRPRTRRQTWAEVPDASAAAQTYATLQAETAASIAPVTEILAEVIPTTETAAQAAPALAAPVQLPWATEVAPPTRLLSTIPEPLQEQVQETLSMPAPALLAQDPTVKPFTETGTSPDATLTQSLDQADMTIWDIGSGQPIPDRNAAPAPQEDFIRWSPQPSAPRPTPNWSGDRTEDHTVPDGEKLDRDAQFVRAPDVPTERIGDFSVEVPAAVVPDNRRYADSDLTEALQHVLDTNASDLHITVGAAPRIRVNGGLSPIEGAPRWMREKVTSALFSILSQEQREKFETELELDFAYATAGARFRVNYYRQRNSFGAAFRLIPRGIKPLKDLGVPESVGRFAELARGLVLVTGPTGSGKSTTLAALIDLVNRTRADHIVTVEDPIEFLHTHQKSLVNQREVGHDTHSFAAALKHVLRQDPDVILIGELRDLETISVALTAAETGHLVFATLHTQDAPQTIDRMIDVFPPHQQEQVRAQLAATLQGVVCQTLVRRANGKGRVVATEVLVTTPAVANLIREGKTYQIPSAMQAGRELGMYTMDQHLAELVDNGKITRVDAMEKAHDAEGLNQMIQRTDLAGAAFGAASGIDYDAHSGHGAH